MGTSSKSSVARWTILGAILALSGLGASRAEAQYSAGRSVELTPFVGYNIASDLYGYYATVPLENGLMWGGRLTVNPNRRSGVEFAYTRATSEVLAPRGIDYSYISSGKIGELTVDSYDMNFLGYQPTGNEKVTPFASLGFGWSVVHRDISISPDVSAANNGSSTLFNFNFALGAKVAVNDRAGLRLEGRWRTTDTAITTGNYYWCDIYGYCYSYGTSWYSNWELVAGLAIKMGS